MEAWRWGINFIYQIKKDGAVVFHRAWDIIASFNYYPADIFYAEFTILLSSHYLPLRSKTFLC